ncbi:hypothetical protein XENOCAPTIV_027659 [Xenoophorus captivus]|uniref:PIPK domain-containing protein n=1 Tax=Xenoophorus captivus TaxID=1517983 RepID=A0ABV0QEU3_9TELE
MVTQLKTPLVCVFLSGLLSLFDFFSRSFRNLLSIQRGPSGDRAAATCVRSIHAFCFLVSVSQMEMSGAPGMPGRQQQQQRSGTVKRRRWGGLRQQWKLLGLFEIDQQHEFYSLTSMMKEGLAAAIQTTIDNPSTEFSVETFAGPVFASLRGSLGITEEEYQQSLCSENCYLQFISNSKSKADFFLTSVNPGSSPIYTSVVGVPGAVPDDDAFRPFSESDSGLKLSHDGDTTGSSFSPTCPEHVGPGADTPEIPDFKTQNRRLLPNLKNPLHVIDGPEQRYFIGIIDIFTVYSFKKRLEHLWKSLRHPGRSFSTVSPDAYCLRLCQWVQDHTK